MGYKIVYRQDDAQDTFFRKQIMTAAIYFLTCYLIHCFWPAGREVLQYYLTPLHNALNADFLTLHYGK